ncbi:ATP-binding protein [Bacteriovoracales bacterium]|nr:ATP-binding protein [Bacteriovoracales bacterium]
MDSLRIKKNESLAFNVIRVVFSIYFFITLSLTTLEMISIYNSAEEDIKKEIKTVFKSFDESLTKSIYTEDLEQVHRLLKGIVGLPMIDGAFFKSKDGSEKLKIGKIIYKNERVYHYRGGEREEIETNERVFKINIPLYHMEDGEPTEAVGDLDLFFGAKHVFTRVSFGFLMMIITATLKTFLLWCLIFWALRKLLTKPLQTFGEEALSTDFENMKETDITKKFFGNQKNELWYFEDVFNRMKVKLLSAHSKLQHHAEKLEKNLEERTKNINTMVNNLEQGFFIFDRKGLILPGASKFTQDLFNIEHIEGREITGLFTTRDYSPQMLEKWRNHLFLGKMPFKDVVSMGPNILNYDGKVIEVEFRPLYKEGTQVLERVVCNATDVTKKSKIESKARAEKDRASMILSLIDSPVEFLDLFSDAESNLSDMDTSSESIDLSFIGRTYHTMKASFARFHCSEIVDLIHAIEERVQVLQGIKERKTINQLPEETDIYSQYIKEFLFLHNQVKITIKKILKENRNVIELASRTTSERNGDNLTDAKKELLNIYENISNRFILSPVQDYFFQYKNIAHELADLQDKQVKFFVRDSKILINPPLYKDVFKSFIHIVRNCIDHGVETREERREKSKDESATVSVSFEKKNLIFFQIIIEDDGKGIDPEKIREIATSKKELNHFPISEMNDQEIIQIVFESGFSSKDKADHLSGRGIGMDAVKKEVTKLEGKIWAESEVGKGTKFILELPYLK